MCCSYHYVHVFPFSVHFLLLFEILLHSFVAFRVLPSVLLALHLSPSLSHSLSLLRIHAGWFLYFAFCPSGPFPYIFQVVALCLGTSFLPFLLYPSPWCHLSFRFLSCPSVSSVPLSFPFVSMPCFPLILFHVPLSICFLSFVSISIPLRPVRFLT